LCFLGRTEAVILIGTSIAALAWSFRRSPLWLYQAGLTGLAFMAGVLPWFIYSYWSTGSWFQNSGAMKMLWAAQLWAGRSPARLVAAVRYLFGQWLTYPLVEAALDRVGVVRGLLGIVLTAALAAILWRGTRSQDRVRRSLAYFAAVLLLATSSTGLVYGALFADAQYWYKAQPGLVVFVVVYGAVVVLATNRGARPMLLGWPVLGAAVVVMALVSAARVPASSAYPWQRDVLSSQGRFDELVPAGKTIGCFNAGIPGFFSKHTITNLDGLVNNALYPYYRTHSFDSYIREAKIRYIADDPGGLARGNGFSRRDIAVGVIDSAPLRGSIFQERYLWRVESE
jgi:hypothetical protein